MALENLKYLSTSVSDNLFANRAANWEKYQSGDFEEDLGHVGAVLELPLLVDLSLFYELDPAGKPQSEVKNSLLVWRALDGLTPNLACENRIWSYICHGPALAYSRARWIGSRARAEIPDLVGTHFFANTITRCRDDNAIGRLWWNAYIANKYYSDNHEDGLKLILKSADIRSNFVERTWMISRSCVATALLRKMKQDAWITEAEINFRETMKALNIEGAGVVFELMPAEYVDSFIARAIDRAHAAVKTKAR
jgi:hypothetical protein